MTGWYAARVPAAKWNRDCPVTARRERVGLPGAGAIAGLACVLAACLATQGRVAGSAERWDAPPPSPAVGERNDTGVAAAALRVLRDSCIECHGASKRGGRLRLDSREAMLTGGRAGPAAAAGEPVRSLLIERIRGEGDEQRMPLERDPLTPEQIAALEAWIAAGAAWPDGIIVSDPHGAETRHWAYTPPTRPPVPPARDEAWPRNPIDRFIASRLDAEGLAPAPSASPAVLLRRLYLDLVGLPPSVSEVLAFEADPSDAAYEAIVDRLLASPRFGEKWARHWLDLARYADSRGFEKDGTWSMWPYRDWVIAAFNADKPFDEFTIEQLAGDLLPGATLAQQVATGFNRCTMINEEGGTDPEEQRVAAVMDRVATTASTWLGATLSCAQCHDHKFDPFTQREYYAFFAFFNNSPAETRQNDRAEIELTSHAIEIPDPRRPEFEVRAAAARRVLEALPPDAVVERRAWHAELGSLESRLKPVTTQVMKELPEPRATHVLQRGSFLSPGEPVEPGVPEVLGRMDHGPGRPTRLELARWIADPANPLTARVAANRLWEQVFGRGLVETSEDFGTRGTPPSHPELLDWLACELVSRRWSQKAIIRLIVTSSTYRQSSAAGSEARSRDPENRLLARGPRFRLEGELIRDTALAAAGVLSPHVGGPSVFPPQPEGVWSNPYYTEPYAVSRGEDRYRRGIYTVWKRSSPYPAFTVFDAPQRQVSCARRGRSNTALQALTTLNDPAFVEAAVSLGLRILRAPAASDPARAEALWRTVLARAPSTAERDRLLALVVAQRARYRAAPNDADRLLAALPGGSPRGLDSADAAAWTIAASVVLNLDEALTKP